MELTIVPLVHVLFANREYRMKVLNLVKNEDGSATVNLDLTLEEAQALMEVGFIKLLEDYIERDKQQRRKPALLQPKASRDTEGR